MTTRTPDLARPEGPVLGPVARSTHTTLVVTAGAGGARAQVRSRAVADPHAPTLRPVLLGSGAAWARVALVAEGALLLAGDHLSLDVEVGPDVQLTLLEPSGVVAYAMRGQRASWSVTLRAGAGSSVVWEGQPFVVAADAVVDRRTTVHLERDARLLLRETLVLGRTGEPPGTLSTSTAVIREQAPVLLEDLALGTASRVPGLLGDHRVLDAVLALGYDAVDAPGRLDLDAGGHLYRDLVHAAHESGAGSIWRSLERGQSVTEE